MTLDLEPIMQVLALQQGLRLHIAVEMGQVMMTPGVYLRQFAVQSQSNEDKRHD